MRINNFVPDERIFNSMESSNIDLNKTNGEFSNLLKDALDRVNDKQIVSDNMTEAFVKGEDVELHEMLLATEEAKMSLQLAVQIRNKLVEAVQELTRMQL